MHERRGFARSEARKALTVCHRVHREGREGPSCFREDRRVAEEAVLRDIHSGLGGNPARPHEVLRVDDVAADSAADKGRPPKPRPAVCWNSMVSDHRTRSCYHLSTDTFILRLAKYFPSSWLIRRYIITRARAHTRTNVLYYIERCDAMENEIYPTERLPSEFFSGSEVSK